MNNFSALLIPSSNEDFVTTDVILHIEDSEVDHEALKRSCQRARIKAPLFWCSDVKDAQNFLSNQGPYQNKFDAPRPAIILLDLNMPGEDGLTLLKKLKRNPKFSLIPIVVLSSSSSSKDVEQSYALGASAYLLKPMDPKDLDSIIKAITYFWLKHTILPSQPRKLDDQTSANDWSDE